MNGALYFPIHRAKAGEITGVGHLSPRTRTRVRPIFEVQKQREDDDTLLEDHLSGVAIADRILFQGRLGRDVGARADAHGGRECYVNGI